MVAATWDRPYPECRSPVWLWHVLPGFLTSDVTMTVFRATEPSYRESFRRFGFPADHPARLENHIGVNGATDWKVSLAGVSNRAVPRYRLHNARGLLAATGGSPAGGAAVIVLQPPAATETPDATHWLLVPRTTGRGYDIVHAGSGQRLVATPEGRGLTLTPRVHPTDHWDVACVRSDRAHHRCHFWMPAFFRDAFGVRFPEDPYPATGLAAVSGTTVVPQGSAAAANDSGVARFPGVARNDALLRATGDSTVGFVAVDPDTGAAFYQGNSLFLDEGRDDGPSHQRERRAYQDAVRRGPGGTGEYSETATTPGGGATFFARRVRATAANEYADCLSRYGLDAGLCESVLVAHIPSSDMDRHALRRQVLGTAPGQVRPGLCTGIGLGSALCQRTCADGRSVQSRVCEIPLRAYCADQTVPLCHDPMCACWLADDTYRTTQTAALERNGIGVTHPLYRALSGVVAGSGQNPICSYGPCRRAALRPDFNCPNTNIMVCAQEMSNNTLASGGGAVKLSQTCNFAAGELGGGNDPAAVAGEAITEGLDWMGAAVDDLIRGAQSIDLSDDDTVMILAAGVIAVLLVVGM